MKMRKDVRILVFYRQTGKKMSLFNLKCWALAVDLPVTRFPDSDLSLNINVC